MVEHDRKLTGLESRGIYSAGKYVGDEENIKFEPEGDGYKADIIEKSKFDLKRSLVNSKTLQTNLGRIRN